MIKEDVGFYIKIVSILNKLKWWIVLISFLTFLIVTFKSEIKHVINSKFLNKDIISDRLENDVIIQNALYDLMEDTNSDRAYVFRFHNGVTYYDGGHKSKMSCDFEVVRDGISQEAQMLQDIPVGLYASFILDVINYKMIHPDIEKIKDVRTKLSLRRQGIKGIGVFPYYRGGKVMALIGVDYVRKIDSSEVARFEENRDNNINKMKIRTQEIGDLLN